MYINSTTLTLLPTNVKKIDKNHLTPDCNNVTLGLVSHVTMVLFNYLKGFYMPGILAKLDSLKDDLPTAERQVAKYVLSNANRIPFESVYDIARAVKVSVASVSRLAKKAGCANFKQFKIEIAQEKPSLVSVVYHEISEDDSDSQIVRKICGGDVRSIEKTLKMLDVASLTKAAKAIARCTGLLCCGLGSSGSIAEDTSFRFAHLGIKTQSCTDPLQAIVRTSHLGEDEVVLGISHSGRSEMTVKCMELAREQGVLTLGISNYPGSPLAKASDLFFCTSFPENKVTAGAISSRVSQIYLVDSLYLLVAKHIKYKDQGSLRIDELAEKYARRAWSRKK